MTVPSEDADDGADAGADEEFFSPADGERQSLRAALFVASDGIDRRDGDAEDAAREVIGSDTAAGARLGRLAEWAVWLSGVQGTYPIRPLDRVDVLLVGGPLPEGHAAQSLVASTGAVLSSVAVQAGSDVTTLIEAVSAGVKAVDAAVDAGSDLLVTTALLDESLCGALVAVLLRLSATEVVGDAGQLDDNAWGERVAAIRDLAHGSRDFEDDPAGLLHAFGSPELAALVGILLRAAARRTPVLLDGAADTGAALCASRIAILASWWWFAASGSGDAATGRALDALGMEPLADLRSELDGGAAALTALPLLRAAQQITTPHPT